MATTTEAPKTVEAIPYTEHDKLGLLGTTQPVLRDPGQLRMALVHEFKAAVDAAGLAARSVDAGPAAAVHGSRKALRRARAIVSLIAGALPKNERRAVRDALRDARHTLSSSRDHAVAPETLAHLPLGTEERETAHKILANAAEAMPPIAEIEQLLKDGATRAAAQVEALEAALPSEIAWSTVAAGIGKIYGAARSARRSGKRSKRAFHTWRRRSKELVYQLEIVARHAGPRVAQLHVELDGITDTASPAVDLLMLREFVETYAQAVTPEALDNLRLAIDAQLGDLMKTARKAGRDAFGAKAARFAKRLTKAVRRDLAPRPPADDDPGDSDHDAA